MKITLLFFYFSCNSIALSQVIPANYHFKLSQLDPFLPGAFYQNIVKKFGAGEELEKNQNITTYKYYISDLRYKFPLFIQVYNGKCLGLFTHLPNYFSHDRFHQSLIKRLGPQDQYFNQENSSVYIWKNKRGIQHIYSGSCTISCFPIYYTAISLKIPDKAQGFKSLLDKFRVSAPYKKPTPSI